MAPHLARAVHTINCVYLLQISKLVDSSALEEYIRAEPMVDWSKIFSYKNNDLSLKKKLFK